MKLENKRRLRLILKEANSVEESMKEYDFKKAGLQLTTLQNRIVVLANMVYLTEVSEEEQE